MAEHLNVLFLLTDQQTASAMSCAGNADLRTPAMDRLAARGARFERAYCTYPLCTPARSSLFTGQYPHQTGATQNDPGKNFWHYDVPREHYLSHVLSGAGYRCVWAGKDMPPADGSRDIELLCPWGDVQAADRLVGFLRGPHERPFLAVGAFVNPHNICEYSRGETLWEGGIGPEPPLEAMPLLPANHAIPPYEPELIRLFQREAVRECRPRDFTAHEWRRYLWAYYRLVELVDREVGRVLDALDSSGLADRTLVVFTSDHGDGAAAHAWNQKWTLYEECVRVPLLLAGPGVDAGRVDGERLVSNGLDLAPTLCEAAGLERPAWAEGESLLGPARGRAAPWRDRLVIETSLATGSGALGPARRNRGRALLRGRTKYAVYQWGNWREQLFDLERDPGEMANLAASARHRPLLDEMRAALHAWCCATGDDFQVPGHEVLSPGARR